MNVERTKIDQYINEALAKTSKNIKDSFSVLKFNLNSILKNIKSILIILFFPFIAICVPIIFIPFSLSGGILNLLSLFMPLLILLGLLSYSIRKSIIFNNIMISGIDKKWFYIGQIFTTILLANILMILFWSTIWILGNWNIFLQDWIWISTNRTIVKPFIYGAWINIIYVTNLTAMIAFATYFLINSFTTNLKVYFGIVMIILILGIIFGGSINTYFNSPYRYYCYDIWNVPKDEGSQIDVNSINNIVTINNVYFKSLEDTYGNGGIRNINENAINPGGNIFPMSMFVPSLFFPQYGVGQFNTSAITMHSSQRYFLHLDMKLIVVDDIHNSTIEFLNTTIVPGIDHFSWKSWYHQSLKYNEWYWSAAFFQPFITVILYFILGKIFSKINKKQ